MMLTTLRWTRFGILQVNAEMEQGVQLLDDQQIDEAVQVFTRVPGD